MEEQDKPVKININNLSVRHEKAYLTALLVLIAIVLCLSIYCLVTAYKYDLAMFQLQNLTEHCVFVETPAMPKQVPIFNVSI